MPGETKLYKLRWRLWLASILLFVISLACPTFCTSSGCDGFGGGLVDLAIGWMGAFLGGSVYLAWLANPFFLIAIFTNKNSPGLSIVMSISAFIMGLNFLREGEVFLNEAGHNGHIISFQIGYWLWVMSFLLMSVASILSIKNHQAT